MNEIRSSITAGFWKQRREVNARQAIFHQWQQLERTGCIDNFRILAEGKPVVRRGWFFADSDAYKWLEAAARILPVYPNQELTNLVNAFIELIGKAQEPDGYLYTFNQIHFPGLRWVNLQIEHELYCFGHLIEAGVTHFEATGKEDLLDIVCMATDRIVEDFSGKGPGATPGHQEVEIALLRLYEVTGENDYLEMAHQFLDMRGRDKGFAFNILRQSISNGRRVAQAEAHSETHAAEEDLPSLPPMNHAKKPPLIKARWVMNALAGKLLQQHKPVRKQTVPVGHAVRFAYQMTAAAMYDRLTGDTVYESALEESWQRMVARRMYITGGIGALPEIEGFGRDFELDPNFAYAETCAALGSLFWNREMAGLTGEARFSDLFEWQLYNAALVGFGQDGRTYFYNNPLAADGGIERRPWYQVPCCPSNLSRTIAGLEEDILTASGDSIELQQYISSWHHLQFDQHEVLLAIESRLPWYGDVQIKIQPVTNREVQLRLRVPSWSAKTEILLNGEVIKTFAADQAERLDPTRASWFALDRAWQQDDQITLKFDMTPHLLRAHPKVRSVRGKAAVACGPLVYCLESCDNPGVDIFNIVLGPDKITSRIDPNMLGGIRIIMGKTIQGQPITFIPYFLWGNRGKSAMTVFVKLNESQSSE